MSRSRKARSAQPEGEAAAAEPSVLDAVEVPELGEERAEDELRKGALSVLAAVPVCATARLAAVEGDRVRLAFGTEQVDARRDPSMHPAVLAGAFERKERVLAEHRPEEGWVVVGALRTQPTPGIDVGDEYTISADRVVIDGKSEVALTAQTASLVVRALGEVESYAERIISRAEGLHRIVGRILHLN